jgi:hypothetical protein
LWVLWAKEGREDEVDAGEGWSRGLDGVAAVVMVDGGTDCEGSGDNERVWRFCVAVPTLDEAELYEYGLLLL